MDMKESVSLEELKKRADYLKKISRMINKARNSFWSYHFPGLYKRFYKNQIKYIKAQANQETLLWENLRSQNKVWSHERIIKEAQEYLKDMTYVLLYWN